MKKAAVVFILVVAVSIAVSWWRVSAQSGKPLATLLPGGALIYLESPDFAKLLREWKDSKVKTDWLSSANYEVFSQSNLFIKLSGVLDEYSAAAGFVPGLNSVGQIAGKEAALALYDMREVQFLYVTRIDESLLSRAELWSQRSKFEARQSAGITFYVHATSGRTVAFAFTEGYLFVGTRDDLVAQALALLAGGHKPSVAEARWYVGATQGAAVPGELRLVLNLESLVASTYFRSYWIQRNVSAMRQYSAGIADLSRSSNQIVENCVLLRGADASAQQAPVAARQALAALLPLAPATAGLYKTWAAPSADFTATLIERKLLSPQAQGAVNTRYAPEASSTGEAAGSEADLETRIDEPPLPADSAGALVMTPLRNLLANVQPQALLQVQSSVRMPNGFIHTPCVLAIAGMSDWDRNAVRESLTAAVETLWTTSRLGAQWASGNAGAHAIERLDGLMPLLFAVRDRVLFIANDSALLAAVLDRPTTPATGSQLTYAAGFRHGNERGNYQHLVSALDFGNSQGPAFFSENIASLSSVLSFVDAINVTASDRGNSVTERVAYEIRR